MIGSTDEASAAASQAASSQSSSPQSSSSHRRLVVVTGASRGLGRALVDALHARGDTQLLGLSRQRPPSPCAFDSHEHWAVDLVQPVDVAQRLQTWLIGLGHRPWQRVTLINNAALLATPGPIEDVTLAALSDSMRVGLEAPTLLSAAFLKATENWVAARDVLHISSGLARRAMAGSAAYGAVKAGLDHLARGQALDQATRRERGLNAGRIVSLAPGVIDTDMQVSLRGADRHAFPERARFEALATQKMLDTPERAAQRILAFMERADFTANPVADVRDA